MAFEPDDFASTWATLVDADPSATIRPERGDTLEPDRVTDLLSHPDGRDALSFQDTIGTGGMGVVRAALQTRLGRVVAVKSLRGGKDALATRRLLDEAWVTGALEHPNVVPIYDIAVDDGHAPHIVMKRITGTQWAEVVDSDPEVAARFNAHDRLDWNLRILATVCNAVSFAHARGVVHRDLKPENVMIGSFGEVYLVDWGIAVAVDPDADERLPRPEPGRIAGTPRYMAPEMVRGEAPTRATDVYLLGGVLHRVLTGVPPHTGLSVRDILGAVARFRPSWPPDVPNELARLVEDAMQPEPAARVPSADAFRLRLETFLAHRGSARLAAEATGHLRDLRAELGFGRDRVRVHGLLGACRFGFREALRAWPENPTARQGLQDALESVARYEIDERDARAAGLLLAELERPDPVLLAEAERLRAEQDAEARALARLTDDQDPRIGQRTRVFVLGLFGVSWVVIPLVLYRWGDPIPSWVSQLRFAALQLVVFLAFIAWGRQSLLATPLNRHTTMLVLLVPAGTLLLHTALAIQGAPLAVGLTMECVLYAVLGTVGSVVVHRSLVVTATAYAVAALATAVEPHYGLLWTSAGSAVLTANLLLLWLPGMPSEPHHRRT